MYCTCTTNYTKPKNTWLQHIVYMHYKLYNTYMFWTKSHIIQLHVLTICPMCDCQIYSAQLNCAALSRLQFIATLISQTTVTRKPCWTTKYLECHPLCSSGEIPSGCAPQLCLGILSTAASCISTKSPTGGTLHITCGQRSLQFEQKKSLYKGERKRKNGERNGERTPVFRIL